MKHTIILFTILLFSGRIVLSQDAGNQVFGQYYNGNYANHLQSVKKLYLTDTTFVINAHVLTNVIADSYVAVFGVSESATTFKETNAKMEDRIQKFIVALTSKLSVSKTDLYVDGITQTKIADYKVTGNYAEQFVSGYEQKKNVIVKFKNIKDLDKMITLAAEYEIYDLIKVDYIFNDIDKVYTQLFQEAMRVINTRKDLYVKATNIKLKATSAIYGESFYSVAPPQLYKSYTPNITAEYFDHAYGKRKDLRKNTTYYYDHINYADFDKVIDPIVTEPAIEFVLMLQIKFNVEKSKP